MVKMTLPTDSNARKEYSIGRGAMAYFPAALAGVARHSFKAGAKHTNGELVHNRWLSSDHEDCIERHLMDLRDMLAAIRRGESDATGIAGLQDAVLTEVNALAWRALALSQELHEKLGGAPLAPAARIDEPNVEATNLTASEVQQRLTPGGIVHAPEPIHIGRFLALTNRGFKCDVKACWCQS